MEDLKDKVQKLKEEVEKAKKDIQQTYKKFEDHKLIYCKEINKNSLKYAHCFEYKIKKPFIKFLKNKIPTKQLKNLKLIKKRKYMENDYCYNKTYYNKEVVEQFKEALEILNKYQDEYEKQCLTEELCKYTDCLEKLTPTRTCLQCNSEYPKEAKFCPSCGCELYKPITKEEQDTYNNLIKMMGLNNIKTNGTELNLTSNIISDIISDQWSYSTINEPTIPKVEKVQEKETKSCKTCDDCIYYNPPKSGHFFKFYCNKLDQYFVNESNNCVYFKKKEAKKERKNICEYFMNLCDKTSILCGTKDYKECSHYCNFKKKEKYICDSCRFKNACNDYYMHDNILNCEKYKKRSSNLFLCKECENWNSFNCKCIKNLEGQIISCPHFKCKDKEKKESTQCPYYIQCGKYTSDSSICNTKDYLHICVFYKNWDLFIKCPYHSTCIDIAPIECYTEAYKQCEHYKKNKSFYYDSCTNKFKATGNCPHDCLNPYCYEPSKKCPYFDKCPSTVKNENNVCKNIGTDTTNYSCWRYSEFKEKQKNKCQYYQQCKHYIKDSMICNDIENKSRTDLRCFNYEMLKRKGGLRSA